MARADFSKLRFNPKKHYRNVLSQQGRVWLDSDWNEESETRGWQDEERMRDLVGHSGVPAPYTAFRITDSDPGDLNFVIGGGPGSKGDFYVDGILCRNETTVTYNTQEDYPEPPELIAKDDGSLSFGLVYLEVWQRLITHVEDASIREIALGGPDTAVRSQTVAQVKVLPLDALQTCDEAEGALPTPIGHGTLTTLVAQLPPDPADICRLPQEVTFTGRENRLYRVEIHEAGDIPGSDVRTAGPFSIALGEDVAAKSSTIVLATALGPASAARLRDGASVTLTDNGGRRESVFVSAVDDDLRTLRLLSPIRSDFLVSATTHVSGGFARFKWSASNGAFVVGVRDISDDGIKLTLTSLGRDNATALRAGDLVEISDDVNELKFGRGVLTRLASDPNPDELTVELEDALDLSMFDLQRHVTLRRWDGEGFAAASFDELTTPQMNLGDGVHIEFGGFDLRVAEYWQIATRVIDGSVDFLFEEPPFGIVRHRTPLAVIEWGFTAQQGIDNDAPLLLPLPEIDRVPPPVVDRIPPRDGVIFTDGGTVNQLLLEQVVVRSDCRKRIPLLTRMIQLHYVEGDGQECLTGEELKRPIGVGVTNGPFAMPGMKVRFSAPHPQSVLTGQGQTGQSIVVITGSEGLAACLWTPPPIADTHIVVASLELSPEDEILCEPLRIIFNAKVDERPVVEPVMVVTEVTDETRRPIENDRDLEFERFIDGIRVVLDQEIEPDTIKRPTVYVTIEIPERESDGLDLGFYELFLRSELHAGGNEVFWILDARVRNELGRYLDRFKEQRYLVRLTMLGNFIWSKDNDPRRFLDGDSFGDPNRSAIELALPSGDARRGGDFRMWFWLLPQRRRRLILNVISAAAVEPVSLTIRRDDILRSGFQVDANAAFDPARARPILAATTAGAGITLLSTPDLEQQAAIIARDLGAVGLNVTARFIPREQVVNILPNAGQVLLLLEETVYDALEAQLPRIIREAKLRI